MPSRPPTLLVGDVGGTKTVLALALLGPQGVALDQQSVARLESPVFPHLRELVARYLATQSEPWPQAACFGVPGPVIGGRCRTTNLPWELETRTLAAFLGLEKVHLINDVAALAWALVRPPLPSHRVLRPGSPVADAPKLVVAVGTGLGAAVVAEGPKGPVVLPSEAGHCDFSPKTQEDWELAAWLHPQVGNVSHEHVVSGPGLARLYRYFAEESPDPAFLAAPDPAAWVVAHANRDPICARAVRLCVRYLGSALGDLALLTLPLSGVFLAGSVASGLAPWLGSAEFSQAFQEKGAHEELLAQVPVYLLEDPLAPLLGCAYAWLSSEAVSTAELP